MQGAVIAVDGAVPRREDGSPPPEHMDPRPSHSGGGSGGGGGFNAGGGGGGGGGGGSVGPGGAVYPVMSAAFRSFALAPEGAGPLRHPHVPSAPRYRPYTNDIAGFQGGY